MYIHTYMYILVSRGLSLMCLELEMYIRHLHSLQLTSSKGIYSNIIQAVHVHVHMYTYVH